MDTLIDILVRQFRENGLKAILPEPGNLRDTLSLAEFPYLNRLNLNKFQVDPTTYITQEYRHLSSDLVIHIPYRTRVERRWRTLTLYLLIEHQSQPDPMMVFRILEYVIQIYKGQLRRWRQDHNSDEGFVFDPVLPLVLYTGESRWQSLTPMFKLVLAGEEFRNYIPDCTALFINLPELSPEQLESRGGIMGQILGLMRASRASSETFQNLFDRLLGKMAGLATSERERWWTLLSYLTALVYHDRPEEEQETLRHRLVASARTGHKQREVERMSRTIAEALRSEGHEQGLREGRTEGAVTACLTLMRTKYGRISRTLETRIRKITDPAILDTLLQQILVKDAPEDLDIPG